MHVADIGSNVILLNFFLAILSLGFVSFGCGFNSLMYLSGTKMSQIVPYAHVQMHPSPFSHHLWWTFELLEIHTTVIIAFWSIKYRCQSYNFKTRLGSFILFSTRCGI